MNPLPNWHDLNRFAKALADTSARAILPFFRRNATIDVKSGPVWDPVTEGDRAGERAMRAMIEERYPEHGICGEEYGVKESRSGFTWILDPVDGTRSFVCGMPTWATLIGLSFEGKPVLGVMNQPFVGDRFFGNPEGAWLDHRGEVKPIKVRDGISLAAATVGTTAPELYPPGRQRQGFEALRAKARLTRYGGDAYFFALLAAGHIDIAMDAGLQSYDIAALLPIISGAGGVYAEWTGGDAVAGGNVIAAGSEALLEDAIGVMAGSDR